ncbi:MAG: helix-turn-helix transcriptional regulator [Dehalococcoidia bacterium]|nr:helix-turn-helix transcriptional regulator [Dehalococcoidia bacterium]
MGAVMVKNADRMMTSANPVEKGIELAFADGCRGLVPFADIPEVKSLRDLMSTELPNPYQLVLRNSSGETIDLPWDFARLYCDPSYRSRVEALGALGRQSLGTRVRQLREAAHLTQEDLATAAGIGRVTLVRIENGDQSPRYETLVSLAGALGRPVAELVAGEAGG